MLADGACIAGCKLAAWEVKLPAAVTAHVGPGFGIRKKIQGIIVNYVGKDIGCCLQCMHFAKQLMRLGPVED